MMNIFFKNFLINKKLTTMENLITLQAKKVPFKTKGFRGFQTELYYEGELKAIIPAFSRQPRKDSKRIYFNCWLYGLQWIE